MKLPSIMIAIGIFAILAGACANKKSCESQYSFEGQKVYSCDNGRAPGQGPHKRFLYECKKDGFMPEIAKFEFDSEASSGVLTCLNSKGDIEIPSTVPGNTSLLCHENVEGKWVEVFFEKFAHHVYYRCQKFRAISSGISRFYRYSNAEVIEQEAAGAFADDNLVICGHGQVNTATDPSMVQCS